MAAKRGSALLIVLGFLSFMVVSAVAFSIYMRSERVPSSVFRRTVQTRHLVKAALGRAIAEIDDAIREDPFPGVRRNDARRIQGSVRDLPPGMTARHLNEWYGRVFMPPNPDKVASGSSQVYDGRLMADDQETVDVLALEGLGYLPPNLINDVRFLARRSFTSKWRMLDYGSGRFAYCAVNVSDYLDVNRAGAGFADAPRTSARRINLASFFANEYNNKTEGVSDAATFADFLHNRGGTQGSWPLVSMLDYALAMRGGVAGLQSPFYRYLGNRNGAAMYLDNSDTAINQPFLTDSWLPPSPGEAMFADSVIDLSDRREIDQSGQPFPQASWMRADNRKNYRDIYQSTSSDFTYRVGEGRLPQSCNSMSGQQGKSLLPLDYVLLHDYLDRDDTPVSLAIPCCERVPMVAAVGIENFNVNFSLTPSSRTEEKMEGNTKIEIEYTEYKITPSSLAGTPRLNTAIVFPFKRGEAINQTFPVRAMIRAFIVEEGAAGLRVKEDLAGLRPNNDNEWDASSSMTLPANGGALPPLAFTWVSSGRSVNAKTTITEQRDAAFDINFQMLDIPGGYENQIVITKKVERKTTYDDVGNQTGKSEETHYAFNATPFAADGKRLVNSAEWIKDTDFASTYGAKRFQVQAAVWVMVEDPNSGDVVDLAPAIAEDDTLYNGMSNPDVAMEGYDGSGAGTPIFRFKSPDAQSLNVGAPSPLTIAASAMEPQSYYAVDPRFNWAPEDWVPRSSSATGDNWVNWVKGDGNLLAMDGRDSDIFMFVSNQGFLQSMGELAFLPRVTSFGNQSVMGASGPVDLLRDVAGSGYNGTERQVDSSWNQIPCRDLVWRTYRPYYSAGFESDYLLNFRNFKGADSSVPAFRDFGDKGVRVNPYTDNEKIRMAAFAYTPYDWWAAAGTNTQWQSSNNADGESARRNMFGDDNLSRSRDYTFNGSSSEARINSDQIINIGRVICDEIRNNPNDTWQQCYDRLDWYGDSIDPNGEQTFQNFLGTQVDMPLHGVDRKFLYAFWRGCLANRQQLFLVFLRAESMALGGTGEGQIPPQQGGRAVALVWRDPETPVDANGAKYSQDGNTSVSSWVPHRTRVLFFHQFD